MAELFAVGAIVAGAIAHRIQQNRNVEQDTRIANLERETMVLKAELKNKTDKDIEKVVDNDDWVTASRITLNKATNEAKKAREAVDVAIRMHMQQ